MMGSEQFAGGAEYTISINETQRAMITDAIKVKLATINADETFNDIDTLEELEMLYNLFKELPEEAKKAEPNTVHGFNL